MRELALCGGDDNKLERQLNFILRLLGKLQDMSEKNAASTNRPDDWQ